MSVFRGIFLSGSSMAALSIDRTQLPAGETGALAQLRSSLAAPQTFSRISGTGITVNAAGVVTVSSAFTEGESRDLVVRVQNTAGDAAERRFSLQGFAVPVAPTITDPGTISGTRGPGQTISGTPATGTAPPIYSWQAQIEGDWAEISGADGVDITDTLLTAPLPLRRRVRMTNSAGSVEDVSNVLPGQVIEPEEPGAGLAYSKLVAPIDPYFLDTVAEGGVLSPMADYQAGAGYIITLIARPGHHPAPANAVSYSGGNYVAGPGWASVDPNTYVLETVNTLTGKLSRTLIEAISNKSTPYAAANASELTAHLTTIAGTITGDGSTFPGAVIDLDAAGDFGSFLMPALFAGFTGMTRKIVLRSSSADRVNGAQPVFQRFNFNSQRHVRLQSLRFRWNMTSGDGQGLITSPNANGVGLSVVNCDLMGGRMLWNADGTRYLDPLNPTDPDSVWHDAYTTFHGIMTGGGGNESLSQLRLWVGHNKTLVTGSTTEGEWTHVPTPAYIGRNLTGGAPGPGNIINIGRDPRITGGVPFAGEAEVLFLTGSTPQVSAYTGQSHTKPAGGPDGNYIVAFRKTASGSGMTVPTSVSSPRGTAVWGGQAIPHNFLPQGAVFSSNSAVRHLILSRNRFVSLYYGIRAQVLDAADSKTIFGNFMDIFGGDVNVVTFNSGSHNEQFGVLAAFNIVGRLLPESNDFQNPHADAWQSFGQPPGAANARGWLEWIGNAILGWGGRGGGQGFFATDLSSREDHGFSVFAYGNFVSSKYPTDLTVSNAIEEICSHNTVLGGFGDSTQSTFNVANEPRLTIRNRDIAGNFRSGALTPTPGTFRDTLQLDDPQSTYFVAPSSAWPSGVTGYADTFLAIRSRYAPLPGGPAVGRGCFADVEQIMDHVRATYDPSILPFRLLLPKLNGQATGALATSQPRRLRHKKSATIEAITNGAYSIGNSIADALDGPFVTAVPATILQGQFLALQHTGSVNGDVDTTTNITIDGVAQTWQSRTAAAGPFPAGTDLDNITVGTAASPTSNQLDWQALTDIPVPDGSLIVVGLARDGNSNTNVAGSDTQWEQVTTVSLTGLRVTLFSWFNDTGNTVNKSLFVNYGGGSEQGTLVYAIIPRTAADATLAVVAGGSANLTSATHQFTNLNAGAPRRHLWGAFVGARGVVSWAAPPNGFTSSPSVTSTAFGKLTQQAGGASGASSVMSFNFVETQTLDANNMTGSAAGAYASFQFAVFETPGA